MKAPLRRVLLIGGLALVAGAAMAAEAGIIAETPSAGIAVSLKPWVDAFRPFTDALAPYVVLALVTWIGIIYQKATGRTMKGAALEQLKSAFATQAGVEVAKAEDNLAGKQITITSPVVANAVNQVSTLLPDAIKLTGITPQGLARLAQGELGKLQAAQTPPVAIPVATPPKIGG